MKRRKKFFARKTSAALLTKSFRSNIAANPFLIYSIVASIALVSLAIIFLGWRMITRH